MTATWSSYINVVVVNNLVIHHHPCYNSTVMRGLMRELDYITLLDHVKSFSLSCGKASTIFWVRHLWCYVCDVVEDESWEISVEVRGGHSVYGRAGLVPQVARWNASLPSSSISSQQRHWTSYCEACMHAE